MPEAMSEKRGLKGLQEWGRKVTDGYRDVNVENLSSSWRDGLAFCAIIHHFRPDLLDYDSLSKENAFENNSLAFSVAEKQLGVPALLDANDMVKCIQPDRLSIATYLSQLYRHFEGGANKKYGYSKSILKRSGLPKNLGSEPPSKVSGVDSEILSGRKYEFCQSCKHRVFILERLLIDGKLYHRTCFKCYRCSALLKPGAYNEGETPGLYECTVCPQDEESEFKSTKMDLSTESVKNNAVQNDSEEIVNKNSNDISKLEENMVLSKSFQQARMYFLQNDLNNSGHLKTKCEPHEPKEKMSYLKSDNATCLTSTPKSSNQILNSENFELPSEITGQSLQQQPPPKTVLEKPPIAKKPELLHITKHTRPNEHSKLLNVTGNSLGASPIRKNSLESNDLKSTTYLETSNDMPQEGYRSIYNRQKLKPLKIELPENVDLNANTDDSLSPNSARTLQLDLPVIKSTSYNTPFLTKSLTRAKSESNFQQTQRLSLLSKALNFSPKRNESADNLEKVLHSNWSKQSNYVSSTTITLQNKDFSRLKSSERSIEIKNDDNIFSSSLTNSENVHITTTGADKTDAILKESPTSSLSKSIETETKVENEEISFSEDLKLEKSIKEADTNSNKTDRIDITEELDIVDLKNDYPDRNLKTNSLDILQDKDVSSLTDTHSTCTVNTEESESHEEEYPDDLNPFGDDEFEDGDDGQNENYPDSLNPFESSEDEDDDKLSSFSKASTLPVTSVNISNNDDKDEYDRNLNPFSSDDDDEGNVSDMHPSSKSLTLGCGYSNTFSFISSESPTGTKKKKKAPPPPPTAKEVFDKSTNNTRSHSGSLRPSPKSSQKRTAPKPPPIIQNDVSCNINKEISDKNGRISEKLEKERNTVEITRSSQLNNDPNKQWRKKKRPAPSVPVPPRRQIKMIPLNEIQSEMAEIEVKQQELEDQGRDLELLIRDCNQDSEPTMEEEEAIMQLFELVNQKNILFRRQAELMYIKRSQRLEEEQVELEFQIRCLMSKPASKKSEEDNQREEELLQRLLDVVEQRNEIVDSIEMDRKSREVQEDQSIQEQTEQKFIEIKEKWSGTIHSKKKDKHKHKKDKKKSNAIKEELETSSKSHKQRKKKSWF